MRFLSSAVLLLVLISATESHAQLYRVYGYDTAERGEAEAVLWNSYVAKSEGTHTFLGETVDREGLWAHTVELEYGLTDRLMVAGYLDFQDPRGASLSHVRTRAVFLRYRFAEPGDYLFDPAIYAEYYVPRASTGEGEELEVRLLLERTMGDVALRLNPTLETTTSGPDVGEGFEFEYAGGVYYTGFNVVQPGLEYYGEAGALQAFDALADHEHVLFPTADIEIGAFEWHVGLGVGLTDPSDDLTIKSILEYEF